MSKTIWIVIAIVVLVGLGYWLLKGRSTTTSAPAVNTESNQTSTTSESSSAVTLKSMAFSPAKVTVRKGATVTWANSDSVSHTVVESDGQTGPKSQTLAPGSSYSFTFDTVGTFSYRCSIHPSMTGTVTVTE